MAASTKHIVGLSGGKDSTALALALKEYEPRDYIYICNPTGNELPEMQAHMEHLESILDAPIIPVTAGKTLTDLIREQKMLPNFRARFCTERLKTIPTKKYLQKFESAVIYIGLRADESGRTGMDYGKHIKQRHPFREWGWGLNDIWACLSHYNVSIPRRTDCAMCYHQRLGEWWELWHNYPAYYAHAEQLEKEIGHTLRSAQRDTWPAALKDLRKEFETGRLPRGITLKN